MPDSTQRSGHVIGVDLGGTKILAGVFGADLKCMGRSKLSTKAQRGPEAVIGRIARCVREAADECDLDFGEVKGVGVGAPGTIDFEGGQVIFAPNLGWKEIPLKAALEKELGVPVWVENDANVCTMAVHAVEWKGKPKNLIGIFIGTGIGAGLILNGRLFSGHTHGAGELGHMVLCVGGPKCGCGNRGCFEALASREAIFRALHNAVQNGEKTVLTELLGPELADLRSGDLRKALKRGDKLVRRVLEEAAQYIGTAVANLINLLNPEVIVLGGGLINALHELMMDMIVEGAQKSAFPGHAETTKITITALGDDAGITGAAILARRGVKLE